MLFKKLKDCPEFMAGDGSMLREYLNPAKTGGLKLGYSLARAKVPSGGETKPHSLKHSEVYYIMHGRGVMCIDDEVASVEEDSVVYIPPGSVQSIKNTGTTDLVFICMVDPAWTPSCEIIL